MIPKYYFSLKHVFKNNIAILLNLNVFKLILNFKTYISELMITVP